MTSKFKMQDRQTGREPNETQKEQFPKRIGRNCRFI